MALIRGNLDWRGLHPLTGQMVVWRTMTGLILGTLIGCFWLLGFVYYWFRDPFRVPAARADEGGSMPGPDDLGPGIEGPALT